MLQIEADRTGVNAFCKMDFFPSDVAQDSTTKRPDEYIERFIRIGPELHFDADRLAAGVGN